MAQTTIELVRLGQEGRLTNLSDEQIQFWIDRALLIVKGAGVSVNHARFAELQEYKVWDLIESTGTIPNEVNSESVGDVSIGMDTNIAIGSAVFWRDRYNEELKNTLGFVHCVS